MVKRSTALGFGCVVAVVVVAAWFAAGPEVALGALILLVLALAYGWLAMLVGVAAGHKGRSEATWFPLAFLFGIIVPAIIVAIMGPASVQSVVYDDPDDYKDCPYCGEEIHAVAKKCKHCGEFLNTPLTDGPPPQAD